VCLRSCWCCLKGGEGEGGEGGDGALGDGAGVDVAVVGGEGQVYPGGAAMVR